MARSVPPGAWLIALGLLVVVMGGGAVCVGLCQRSSENAEVREGALSRCVSKLGDEAECRRRIEAGHEDCAVYARPVPSRFSRVSNRPDPDVYLECVLLSPSAWAEKRRQERAAQAAERARDLSGH